MRVGTRQSTGTPLLLLNGIGASSELLEPLIEAMPDVHLITIDIPGTGGSSGPFFFMSMSSYADLVAKVLLRLRYFRVCVMGISWGGALAQEFAVRFKSMCLRLVLAATNTGLIGAVPPTLSVLASLTNPLHYVSSGRMLDAAHKFYGGVLRDNKSLARAYGKKMIPRDRCGYISQLIAFFTWTGFFSLPKIRQPTLVLSGVDDPVVPPLNARLLAMRLPSAKLQFYPCGHLFFLTQAELVGREVTKFLRAV
ncbi:MAG: alpha/beta fold hydrolase [Pseudomonadota bacterium]